jgi:LacI family transcriptional regulator
MNSRVTIYDIAKAACVSTTSVYKALNEKRGLSDETRELILNTAKIKGYRINSIAKSLASKPLRIGVVIDQYSPEFSGEIIRGLNDAFNDLSDYKVEAIYGKLESISEKVRVIDDVKRILKQNIDGIILCPNIAYEEYRELLSSLSNLNVPCILITSDIPGCKKLTIVKHNAFIVGELGAELLTLHCNNRNNYALFVGNKDISAHSEVISGFTNRLKQINNIPIAIYETQDDDNVGYYATEKLLKTLPNISGIFVGDSFSKGVCKKLIETGRIEDIKLVTVDTYPQIIKYMEEDIIKATIFQNPYMQGNIAVKKMFDFLSLGITPASIISINPRVVLKSNLRNFAD